jgi:hypothetical protein
MSMLNDCWRFGPKTNQQCARVTPGQLQAALDFIDTFFAAHIADPSQSVGVAFNCPGSWEDTPLEPLYAIACAGDEDEAAMLVGNLYCRVAIRRSELWWSFNAAELDHHPRKYVTGADIQRAVFGV